LVLHLLKVDWRIDVKTAAEQMSRMAVPTVLVDLKVRAQLQHMEPFVSVRLCRLFEGAATA
jgi:hypothetical protein